jgi:hypothetical protein
MTKYVLATVIASCSQPQATMETPIDALAGSQEFGATTDGVCGAQCSSDLNCATGGLKACNKCFFGTCYPLLPPFTGDEP